MSTIFETRIKAIGPEAENMIEEAGMFILFGDGAPDDLAQYCFTIDNKEVNGEIQPGGQLLIDGHAYPITAVGNVVEKNLSALGHITVSLDGSLESSLPGTLHVDVDDVPVLKEGALIQIVA
ncbi:PTS glucitol/sorbitol transporter subunit IIA [Streptococcus gallolyticus]|nr:PTS glucitol/sorbitol transporter subunit IIA [Streptococcus gallolyticus]MBY5040614.1 PTS glucitol/sorbitol transporter subunit IIA [Streptococcus gallolyticus]